jgi:hypothetical protein
MATLLNDPNKAVHEYWQLMHIAMASSINGFNWVRITNMVKELIIHLYGKDILDGQYLANRKYNENESFLVDIKQARIVYNFIKTKAFDSQRDGFNWMQMANILDDLFIHVYGNKLDDIPEIE